MYAIIGEDNSDVEMLNALIRRMANAPHLSVKRKGYKGCAEMLEKGWRQIKAFSLLGCTHFIICYDSDREDPEVRRQAIVEKIIKPSGVDGTFCALVPIQEIEAWILADLPAIAKIITSWRVPREIKHPERIVDPKEHLETLCRKANAKPLYVHAVHNSKVACHLDLEIVRSKCPSSVALFELMKTGQGNYQC
jgi:hypothetical protein